MCFSASADLAAGIVVSGVGVDALRRADTPWQLPLATLPLVFGVHQLVEAFVWWGLADKVPMALGDRATWIYLAIAFVLPVWVPLAVRGVEPSRRRRLLMSLLAAVGAMVAGILLWAIIRGPVGAAVDGHHIAYSVQIPMGITLAALYVLATCGTLLLSGDRWIRTFGFSNLAAVVVLVWLTVGGLTSLWCVWAAVTSVAIDLYLREAGRRRAHPLVA